MQTWDDHFNCGSRLREGLIDLHHSSITHVESMCLTMQKSNGQHFCLREVRTHCFICICEIYVRCSACATPSNTITTVICLKPQECLYPLILFSCRKQLARAHYLGDRASHITVS
jgi:hypothetical protein